MNFYRRSITISEEQEKKTRLEAYLQTTGIIKYFTLRLVIDGKVYAFTYEELKQMVEAWKAGEPL